MYFMVDNTNKIIFCWSPKCGCSHIKTIYWFLQTNHVNTTIHTNNDINSLPNDIENYITLIFCRNPYKRVVSGFLDKYKTNGEYRNLCKNMSTPTPTLSFSQFVDEIMKKEWKVIDHHHFAPQTEERFDKKILLSKNIKFYDISNIDYGYIEQLYNKKIPEYIINKKYGHERKCQIINNNHYDKPVYDLNIDDYINDNVNIKYFYNKDIKNKIFMFYKNDFIFFNENGIDYINTQF